MNGRGFTRGLILTLAAGALASCASPLERSLEQKLREELLATNAGYRQAVAAGPVVELSRTPSDTLADIDPARQEELNRTSGPEAYRTGEMELEADLLGKTDSPMVGMTLKRALQLAVQNNLSVQGARIVPSVSDTLVTQAQAAFDAVFFGEWAFSELDTVRPPAVGTGVEATFGSTQERISGLSTGVRKRLTTGGQISATSEFNYNRRNPPFFTQNPYWDSNVALSITQPLLRGFGEDVNRSEILLAQSAKRQSVEDFRTQLLTTLVDTEAAYWNLVFAQQRLLIQMKLLERTIDDRNKLRDRLEFDVTRVRITEANSFVEIRRSEVIRARQQVRVASDALKQLVNAPELSVAGEELIKPLDWPADAPVKFSLLDAVATALRERPDLRRALLQIQDASIRQRVADNLRLPRVDASATVRFNGVDSNLGGAYDVTTDGDFIDYILGVQFEVPIGNRGPEALYEQRKIERRGFVIAYRNQAQVAVVEVKNALRDLITAYELIGASRAARLAAADSLRAIEAQEDAGVALTPEFLLDLKLSTQQRLADTETQEIRALADYNTAIANFYRVLGTLLEYNGFDFQEPEKPTP